MYVARCTYVKCADAVPEAFGTSGCDMNIRSDAKQSEKVDYMHNSPLARRLVDHPGGCPWSNWRFYYREDRSLQAMDRGR